MSLPQKSIFVAIAALFLLPAGAARAQESAGPKFVGFDFYPLGRIDNSGNKDGLFFDLMTIIEKNSGVKVQRKIEPIPRALRGIGRGDYDLTISSAKTKAFADTTSLGVLGCSRLGVTTRKDAALHSLTGLKGKKIGYVTGGFLLKKFGGKFGELPLLANTSSSMFRMLLAGRVEGIFISDLIFDTYWLAEIPFSNISPTWRQKIGGFLVAEVLPVHLRIVNKSKFKHLSKRLNAAVEQALKDGEIEKIYRKYGIRSGGKC